MAYKQKPYRVQTRYVSSDSEEASASEQEWVVFGTRKKPTPARDLTPPKISDDEWHVLSDTASPVEENTLMFENVSSGGSGFNSEADLIHDENSQLSQGSSSPKYESTLIGLLPSHDGAGNFSDPSDSTLAFIAASSSTSTPAFTRRRTEKLLAIIPEFDVKENTPVIGNSSPISLRVTNRPYITSQEQTTYEVDKAGHTDSSAFKTHQNADSDSSSNVSSGPLSNTETSSEQLLNTQHNQQQFVTKLFNISSALPPFISREQGSDLARSNIHSTNMSRIGNIQRDPMLINFSPTISNDNFTGIINNEHGKTGSDAPQQSLLSTVWTSFRRFTSNIVNADAELYNDLSQNTAKSSISSTNQHFSGLAAIINGTGENQYSYDSCHLPFGSYLTLTDLGCFSRGEREIWSSRHHTSLKHQSPSYSSSSHQTRVKSYSSAVAEKTVLTPVSSSTSLKSFASRGGSDCGRETDFQYREADCTGTRMYIK